MQTRMSEIQTRLTSLTAESLEVKRELREVKALSAKYNVKADQTPQPVLSESRMSR